MSFELILPSVHPIRPLIGDHKMNEVLCNPDPSWWYERDGIVHRGISTSFDARRLGTGRAKFKPKRWTASVNCVLRDNVKNNELAVNLLGLTLIRFRADQAFEKPI